MNGYRWAIRHHAEVPGWLPQFVCRSDVTSYRWVKRHRRGELAGMAAKRKWAELKTTLV